MSWFKRNFGLDWVDTSIHAVLTGIAVIMANELLHGTWAEFATLKVLAASIVVFAIRRRRALARARQEAPANDLAADQIAVIEQRLSELESAHDRVAELEERLDFTERLLAKTQAEQVLPPGGRR